MFTLIYKTILISIMSCSMITMNNVALADSVQVSTTREKGVVKKTETHTFKSTEDENAVNIITMIAVGIIGAKLLSYKKWTKDMILVAVASAAYLAAEIVNIMNLKNQLEEMSAQATKRSDGKIDQTQIKVFEDLKESYQKVKKSAQTKKMLQLAAATAYAGALGMAIWDRIFSDNQLANCQNGIINANAELAICTEKQTAAAASACTATAGAGCAAAEPFLAEAAACTACAGTLTHLSTSLATAKAKDAIPWPSMPKASQSSIQDKANVAEIDLPCSGTISSSIKSKMVTPSCSTYMKNKELQKGFGAAFSDPVTMNSSIEKLLFAQNSQGNIRHNFSFNEPHFQRGLLQKALDVFISRSEAGVGAMLGITGGALLALGTAKTAVGQWVDKLMFTPGGRIVVWGLMTGIAKLGADATQKEMDKIDTQIEKIDNIITEMNRLAKGIKLNNVSQRQINITNLNAIQESNVQLNSNASMKTDCIANTANGACASTGTLISSMPGFGELPLSFQSIASQTGNLGDGLSGTNALSGATLANAASLGSKNNAISKINDALKSKLNDSLSKSGKPKIDFDKQEKELWGQLKAETRKALKSNNISPGSFISNTGLSPIADSAASPIPTSKFNFRKGEVVSSGKDSVPENSLDMKFVETEIPSAEIGGGESSGPRAKFDIGANDITTSKGASIFEIISNRYIKSGYPKLLEEIPAKK